MTLLSEVAKGQLLLDEYVFVCHRRIPRVPKKVSITSLVQIGWKQKNNNFHLKWEIIPSKATNLSH